MIDKNLSLEALELRRAYQRKWRAANKLKVQDYQRRFWEKKAASEQEKNNDGNENK